MRPIVGIGKRYCNRRYGHYFSFYQTLWRLWEMTKRSLKEKEILFPGSYDNVKINESTKAFRLIDDQCSWVTINLTAPTTSTRYLKRIPSLLEHLRHHRRAGHGSMSARARGAPPCKKYNLERGNRPSIQLPTPSPIISFITWMLHGIFSFETRNSKKNIS